MDGNHHMPNAHVDCWTTHQVTGTRRTSPAQMAYRFESLQEPLSRRFSDIRVGLGSPAL